MKPCHLYLEWSIIYRKFSWTLGVPIQPRIRGKRNWIFKYNYARPWNIPRTTTTSYRLWITLLTFWSRLIFTMPGISEALPQGRYQGRLIHRALQQQHSENHTCFDSNAPDEAEIFFWNSLSTCWWGTRYNTP